MEKTVGIVDSVVFQSNDNSFCVFRLKSKKIGKVSVVYKSMAPFVGEEVELTGKWGEHPKFGRQFQALTCKALIPTTSKGVENFLASGAIAGVGKAMATRIVEKFGDKTLEVLGNDPKRLTEVVGIGSKTAERIKESYLNLSDVRGLMLYLEEHGISSNYAGKLHKAYGGTAITRIENNPYCLVTDIRGIGFKTADRMAIAMGIEEFSDDRIKAGLEYILVQSANVGHTCIPTELLLKETTRMLQIDFNYVNAVFQKLIDDDLMRIEEFGANRLVYAEYLYRAEHGTATRLLYLRDEVNKLLKVDYKEIIKQYEKREGLNLAEQQIEAIKASLEHGIFVLTGGPGTGKTTVIKGILAVLERAGCKILLAAPTGRAARRLAESSGHKASTVHRMLEYTPNDSGFNFGKNEEDPLAADAIIVDEASMLDIVLMSSLLKAVPVGCRLILVGDVDQLPSVGPGSVLKDIIDSKKMPVVRLDNIFRQAALSGIVTNAHRINQGRPPVYEKNSDFEFVELDNEAKAAQYIVDLYADIRERDGWENVQILSPMHKNICGVQNLNKLLQDKINPPEFDKPEVIVNNISYREGDKVMQIRNNYEKEVFNGDIGIIKKIQPQMMVVYFPDVSEDNMSVVYSKNEFDELQLAYAMSVHKSQGSEYKTVIMAVVNSHYILLQRNLLYTGITRAKAKVVLVGSERALNTAVFNDKTRKRYSLLASRLQDENVFQ